MVLAAKAFPQRAPLFRFRGFCGGVFVLAGVQVTAPNLLVHR
jgi:hypothetical protein